MIAARSGRARGGTRCVAGYDEDSTTLGVAAALPVVAGREQAVGSVWLATTDPVYADKTNATAVHAALGLPAGIIAADLGASAALRRRRAARRRPRPRPRGAGRPARRPGRRRRRARRRRRGGGLPVRPAGAARHRHRHRVGHGRVHRPVARARGSTDGAAWEERFGEQRYAELAGQLLGGLTEAGVDLGGVAPVRRRRAATRARCAAWPAPCGRRPGRVIEGGDLADVIGNAGAAQAGSRPGRACSTRPSQVRRCC